MSDLTIVLLTVWYLVIGIGANNIESHRSNHSSGMRRVLFIFCWPIGLTVAIFFVSEKS